MFDELGDLGYEGSYPTMTRQLRVRTTSGTTISFIRDPYGNLVVMRTGGQSYYYTADAQGSVIALTDSTQALAAAYTYDPWGNTAAAGALAATNPWTYATGYTDPATGYLKLGARYYNPTTGRFTQPDPSGLWFSCGLAVASEGLALVGFGMAPNATGVGAVVGVPLSIVGLFVAGIGVVDSCYPGYLTGDY